MLKNLLKHLFLLLFFTIFSCKKDSDIIPYAPVDFEISIYDPEYSAIANAGSSILINESNGHMGYFGYGGIILYHSGDDEIYAFDATCTKDLNALELTDIFIAEDPICGSRFSLPSDGNVIKGPASIPLKKYNVLYNKSSGTIAVYN